MSIRLDQSQLILWAVSVAVILFSCGLSGQERKNQPYSISIVAFQNGNTNTPATVWLGIKNDGPKAQLICIRSKIASFTPKDRPGRVEGEGFSPHGCQTDDSLRLLLRGETSYEAWSMPSVAQSRSDRIEVLLQVSSRNVDGTGKSTWELRWAGTSDDMLVAGSAVAKR